jgi:hypothetical protein
MPVNQQCACEALKQGWQQRDSTLVKLVNDRKHEVIEQNQRAQSYSLSLQ